MFVVGRRRDSEVIRVGIVMILMMRRGNGLRGGGLNGKGALVKVLKEGGECLVSEIEGRKVLKGLRRRG